MDIQEIDKKIAVLQSKKDLLLKEKQKLERKKFLNKLNNCIKCKTNENLGLCIKDRDPGFSDGYSIYCKKCNRSSHMEIDGWGGKDGETLAIEAWNKENPKHKYSHIKHSYEIRGWDPKHDF